MKIKELFESTKPEVIVRGSIRLEITNDRDDITLTDSEFKALKDVGLSLANSFTLELSRFNAEYLDYSFNVPISKVNKLVPKMFDKLGTYIMNDLNLNSYITHAFQFYKLPTGTFTFNLDDVNCYLYLTEENIANAESCIFKGYDSLEITFYVSEKSKDFSKLIEFCKNNFAYQVKIDFIDSIKIGLLNALKLNCKHLSITGYEFDHRIAQIIISHFKNGRNILKCQKELINAGFKDYAK